jgi:hypothetical protein
MTEAYRGKHDFYGPADLVELWLLTAFEHTSTIGCEALGIGPPVGMNAPQADRQCSGDKI